MLFPMIVYKSENSDYAGLLPDFPGCYPSASTLDDLLTSVQDAVETWMDGEDPSIFPQPTSLDTAYKLEEAQGRVLVLVDVSTAFLDQATQRINITVPRYALGIIDKAAKMQGLPRSTFLVRAALEQVQAHN